MPGAAASVLGCCVCGQEGSGSLIHNSFGPVDCLGCCLGELVRVVLANATRRLALAWQGPASTDTTWHELQLEEDDRFKLKNSLAKPEQNSRYQHQHCWQIMKV